MKMGTHINANCLPYHSHSDLIEPPVIMHRLDENAIYTPDLSRYCSNVSWNLFCMLKM